MVAPIKRLTSALIAAGLYIYAFIGSTGVAGLAGLICLAPLLVFLETFRTFRSKAAVAMMFFFLVNLTLFSVSAEHAWVLAGNMAALVPGLFVFLVYPALKGASLAGVLVLTQSLPSTWRAITVGCGLVLFSVILEHFNIVLPDNLYLCTWKNPEFIQTANLFGAHFITFVLVVANVCTFLAMKQTGLWRRMHCVLPALLLLAGSLCYSTFQPAAVPTQTVALNVIQPNIPWQMGLQCSEGSVMERLIQERLYVLSKTAQAEHRATVTVWPEAVYGKYVLADGRYLSTLSGLQTGLLFGTVTHENDRSFNSAALLSPNYGSLVAVRSKSLLIPVYETVKFAPKADYTPFPTWDHSKGLGVMICYESMFTDPSAALVANGARALINLSNDAVFGNTNWCRLHSRYMVFRAIEHGRWGVHLNNNGGSLVTNDRGEIQLELAAAKVDYAGVKLPLIERKTFFGAVGSWFEAIAYFLFVVGLMRSRANVRARRTHHAPEQA